MKSYCTCWAVALAFVLSLPAFAEEKEEPVKFDKLPAAAQEAIKEQAGKGRIVAVSKETSAEGVAFEARIEQGKRKLEVSVSADGKLLSIEEQVAMKDLPDPVRKTMQEQAAGGKLSTIEKVTEGGKTCYEAKVTKSGKKIEIQVADDGKLLKTEDVTKEKE